MIVKHLVSAVPNAVEDIRVSSRDLHFVLVMWRPPSSSVVEEYKVTITELSGSTQYVNQSEEYVSYNVSGLDAGTHYTVSVRSVSGGRSKESPASTLTITTLPASVESFDVTTDTDSVHVNWSLPADITYDFLNISLSADSGVVDSVSRNKSSPDAPNHRFINLESGSLYVVTIVTTLSNGIMGHPINKTAITKPVPIKGITFSGQPKSYSLAFSWTVYPAEAHGYMVTVTDLSNASIPRYEETVTGKDANATGLYPGHYYEVGLRAFVNYTGTVVYSDSVTKNTTTKPLPVLKLNWTSSPADIIVSWQASAEAQSRHDAFEFRYRTVLRDPNSSWIISNETQPEATVKVFPGEKYDVEVRTRAGHITSDVKQTSVIIAPKAPQSVSVITDRTSTDSLYVDLQVDEHLSYATHWNFTLTPNSPSFPVVTKSIVHPFVNLTEIGGLRPGETYTIDVYSVTVGETRSESSAATSGTVRPVLDTELAESDVTNSTLTLTYTENSPVFDSYYFQLIGDKAVVRNASQSREIHFEQLTGGQIATITAWVNSSGVTSEQKTYHFQTDPNMVLTEFVVHATEISVILIKPEGNVDYYNITCYNGSNICGFYHLNASENQQEVNFTDLTAYQDYSFTIITASGQKHVNKTFSKQTAQSAPSVVRKVSAIVLSPNTVQVRWERPELSNGDITKYQVRYVGKLEGKSNDEKTRWLSGWEVPPTNVTLPNLRAGYTYTFYVSAYTVTLGPAGDTTLTVAAYPPPFKDSLKTEDLLPTTTEAPSPTTAKLKFVNAFSQKGGEVIAYTIIVSTDNSTEQKMPVVLPGWQTAQNDPAIKAYQAIANCTEFFRETSDCHTPAARKRRSTNEQAEFNVFTIGTEKGCEQKVYCNGPLKPDTEYYIALRAFTAGGPSDTPYSKKIRTASIPAESDPGPVIGGVVTGVLIIAILVLAVVLYRHWQRRPNMYKKEDHELDSHVKRSSSRRTKASRIVKLTDFPDHFMLMSADSDYRFAEEFEELRDVGRDQSCNAAELPQNRAKNRFTNILPYDHSRVKLLPTDDEEGSDYINANYMPGYNSRREYIVTQGPLHSTRDDFWRLLWEQNTRNIIMLTRCVEKGREKCDHYWPQNSENMFYGDLQVAILNETKFPDWTITEFRVSLGDNSRKVRHFHYTAWPDFGVPDRPLSLVKFVTTVREKMIPEGGPQIVHCSAGVGRSGTFIALDRLLQHIQHNDWVDPYGIVYEMRCQRVWMVQTEQQYICIHQCLLSVLQGYEEEPVYCNQAHDNVGFEDDEGINVEIM
ncbi:tyrosine-protein phosphatase 10D-like isoform X2 [Liolophura sinensis]|uniref:tyrosine-protein phosphatase 10D-like isoform X2 n=1 Tax=Liolophura sinensis TaxID=3198878 RepID=UPI00315988D4